MNTTLLTIETERLKLYSISRAYARDIFENFTNELTKYMFPAQAEKIEDTLDYVDYQYKCNRDGLDYGYVIIDKTSGEFLGCGGLHHIDRNCPVFGIWIKKEAHGKGYAKEAMYGVGKWAINNIDINGFIYDVDYRNIPSRRIAEGMGGKLQRMIQKVNCSGNTLELAIFFIDLPTAKITFNK